jgi:hypothetical protein
MITVFAESSACLLLLTHCGLLISNSNDDAELEYCYTFVDKFMDHNDARRKVVYDYAVLREANFGYFSERFVGAACATQRQASNIAVLFYNGSCKAYGAHLLRAGALPAVKQAAFHVFSIGATERHLETILWSAAGYALWTTLTIVTEVPVEQLASLSDEMYKFSRADLFRMNVFAHDILTGCRATNRKLITVDMTLVGYADYLLEVLGQEALKSFLLYKRHNAAAKSTAQLMAEVGSSCGDVWRENFIIGALRGFAEFVPEVAELLSALRSTPGRVANDRHWALPRCEVVDTALQNHLKRCSRCRAAYYCCRLHQEEHWPTHKLTCVKTAPADGAAQGVKM